MTWAKIDDQYFRHPMSRAAGKDGRALDLAAELYSVSSLTDGFVSHDALKLIAAEAEVSTRVARKLVQVGRWEEVPGGFELVGFLDRQRSRDRVEAERDATAQRVKKHRDQRRGNAVTSNARNAVTSAEETLLEGETERDLSSSTRSFTTGMRAVDDDEFDAVSIKCRAVFERCTDARMQGKTPSNPAAYRATVFAEFRAREPELRDVITVHPSAPVASLAGWMLGEQNSLHCYRVEAAS